MSETERERLNSFRKTLSRLETSFNTPTQLPLKLQRFRNQSPKKAPTYEQSLQTVNPNLISYHFNTPSSNFLSNNSPFEEKSLKEDTTKNSYEILDLKNQLVSNCNSITSAIGNLNKTVLYTGK